MKNMSFASVIVVISCTNFKYLGLLACRVGRIEAFNAPISEKFKERLVTWGIISNIFEDIPQLILQSYVVYYEAQAQGYVSLTILLSIVASTIVMCIEVVQRCKWWNV